MRQQKNIDNNDQPVGNLEHEHENFIGRMVSDERYNFRKINELFSNSGAIKN